MASFAGSIKGPCECPSSRFKAAGRWGKHKGRVQVGNKTSHLPRGGREGRLGDTSVPAPNKSGSGDVARLGHPWIEHSERNPTAQALPQQRGSPAPSPSHPTTSLLIKFSSAG